ncbi:hypothetical protein [Halobacteriovorax sp. HLS]|uniref:hypothetical protein n=1 Tax=Halobacteriovorax sp. HLS TaxID=2234000 RepID=UPI000FDA58E8|nr:hypothetical protein [Halobacteriovorax sp. HLS]
MKKTITALAVLACANTFALTVDLEVSVFQKILFEKTNSTTLSKIHSSAETKVKGVVKEGDQVANISESQPAEYNRDKNMLLIIKDKHSLQLIDTEDGINEVVTAKIDKSWGKIKKIEIESDIYKALYNKQLEALGGAIFGNFGIAQDNVAFSFGLDLSNFECAKEYDGLVECYQTLTFKMTGSDEVENERSTQLKKQKQTEALDEASKELNSYIGNLEYRTSYDIQSYISILKEVKVKIDIAADNSTNSSIESELRNLSRNIYSEILDSLTYSTAKGQYIEQMFEDYSAKLKKIRVKL